MHVEKRIGGKRLGKGNELNIEEQTGLLVLSRNANRALHVALATFATHEDGTAIDLTAAHCETGKLPAFADTLHVIRPNDMRSAGEHTIGTNHVKDGWRGDGWVEGTVNTFSSFARVGE